MNYEYCEQCGEETERAGCGDDSIYISIPNIREAGPLCVRCYQRIVSAQDKASEFVKKFPALFSEDKEFWISQIVILLIEFDYEGEAKK